MTENGRVADYPIDPLFLARWSPRAFGDDTIELDELYTMFEAARWAPSSSNAQPWRFLYARRASTHWARFLGLLSESNQTWAGRAAALVFVISKTVRRPGGAAEDVPSYSHSFDTGAAWAQLALQATRMGWHAHGMGGFDKPRAVVELQIPDRYRVEAAVAIGKSGDPARLTEAQRARETPSTREPLSSTVFEGLFPA